MDVSGLTLPTSDVTDLNNYIESGGTVLPAGATDGAAMLTAVQTHVSGVQFVMQHGASISDTLSAIQTTLEGLTAASGLSLSSVLPGNTVFHQGISSNAGVWGVDFGFVWFKPDLTLASAKDGGGTSVATGTYNMNGNILTLGNSDTIKVLYVDSFQGFWTDQTSNGTAAGMYAFLQNSFNIGTIAGRTRTITGPLGSTCNGVSLQLVISSQGTSYTANCQGGPIIASGSIAPFAIAGVLEFDGPAPGDVHLVGLVTGGSITRGSLAVVAGTSSGNGIFGVSS